MKTLTGSTGAASAASPVTLRTVTVTPPDGAGASVELYRYNDVNGDPIVVLKTLSGQSAQWTFDGIPFYDGLTVVPSSNVVSFVVEYD